MEYFLIGWIWINGDPITLKESYPSKIACESVVKSLELEFKYITYNVKCRGM